MRVRILSLAVFLLFVFESGLSYSEEVLLLGCDEKIAANVSSPPLGRGDYDGSIRKVGKEPDKLLIAVGSDSISWRRKEAKDGTSVVLRQITPTPTPVKKGMAVYGGAVHYIGQGPTGIEFWTYEPGLTTQNDPTNKYREPPRVSRLNFFMGGTSVTIYECK